MPSSTSRPEATSAYHPTSRRPIAATFRRTATLATAFCVRQGIHPDIVSYASVFWAAAAALCLVQASTYPLLLIVAPLFCYLRLWCNMLDGMVALATDHASPRGELVNDLPDRVSDVIIFAAVAHSGFANLVLAYWTALAALSTAYVGTLGQAVAGRREFGGLMSKPWRMVALHAGAWATWLALFLHYEPRVGPFTLLDWTCLIIIGGGVQTMFVRVRRSAAALRAQTRI